VQHWTLGKNIRQFYIDQNKLLSPDSAAIWVRSTNVQRTINSIQANLAGVFPSQQLSSAINIFSIDDWTDNMTPNSNICPHLQTVYNQQQQLQPWKDHLARAAVFQAEIARMGYYGGVPSQVNLNSFTDSIWPRICHNFPLPPLVNRSFFNQVWKENTWTENNMWWGNHAALPWSIGSFVAELLERMYDVAQNRPVASPILYYSGHDSTLSPLTWALGISDGFWPPYASHVEIELYSDSNSNFYVRTNYNGLTKFLPGCPVNALCPLAVWKQSVSWLMPSNYLAQCTAPPIFTHPTGSTLLPHQFS